MAALLVVAIGHAMSPPRALPCKKIHPFHYVSLFLGRDTSTVFDDPLAITYPDSEHSTGESRYVTFGLSSSGRILVVSHSEINSGIRIISARKTDRAERKIYEQG